MQAPCSQCGTQHTLSDAQIGDRPRVQFRCSKCGLANIVEVRRRPDRTVAITPLPSFARVEGAKGTGMQAADDYPDLSLPVDRVVTLSVIGGPAKGLIHRLEKPRVVLGRTGADVEINDPGVSRWHCAVEVKDDIVTLRDLDSTNGTYFGDERARAAELKHLSEFRLGSTVVLVTILPKLSPPL